MLGRTHTNTQTVTVCAHWPMQLDSHTYNIMCWYLSPVRWQTKNNISLLSRWWRGLFGCEELGVYFLFASLRILADQQNSLTLPHLYLLNNFGRREYMCVLHGSGQEMCAGFQCKLYRVRQTLDGLHSFVLNDMNSFLAKWSSLLWAQNYADYALYKNQAR